MEPHDLKTIFSSKSDEYSTPQFLFDKLDKKWHFTLDPCATDQNHKCAKYYTIDDDGLSKSWKDEVVFINPPYSKLAQWLEKAHYETINNDAVCVMLIPSRTDTVAWHKYVMSGGSEITFIKGRLKFGNETNCAPFPSCIVKIGNQSFAPPTVDSMNNKP